MPLNFSPISLDGQKRYRQHVSSCAGFTSDYAFANLWGWADHYGLQWSLDGELAWIRQTRPEMVYWAPVGPWQTIDWSSVEFPDDAARFTRVPQNLAMVWEEEFGERASISENRDHFDYVYDVQELTGLRGNRFHKKKNLVNQFNKKYDWEYRPMDPDCVEEALELQAQWLGWFEHDSPTLLAENTAITRVLTNFDQLCGLVGGAIRVEGTMVAYTVAEPMCEESMIVHFEKGNTAFKGVYQAINREFLANQAQEFVYVNREQDVGDEGLRKAKLSYNPKIFLEKFEVKLDP